MSQKEVASLPTHHCLPGPSTEAISTQRLGGGIATGPLAVQQLVSKKASLACLAPLLPPNGVIIHLSYHLHPGDGHIRQQEGPWPASEDRPGRREDWKTPNKITFPEIAITVMVMYLQPYWV